MAPLRWQLNFLVALLLASPLVLAADSLHPHTRRLQADADRGLFTDTEGLLNFKQRIEKDPRGVLNGWDLQTSSNSCDWFGITCANARIIALDLSGYGLVGPLPTAALAPLDQLQEIRLASNSFYGYGADQVASSACNTLTVLDLSSNQLNGSFSNIFLQNCKTLTYLNVSHNAFLGSLPSSTILGDASSIIWLDLSHNNFFGMLSADIFKHCGALLWLDFSSNSISGNLPAGISQCAALQHLDVSFNLLDGTLPANIFPLSPSTTSNLTSLQLSSNKLSGNIPHIASCANAVLLDLSNNAFTGELPSSLGACTHMRLLNLSYNALTGNLPSFLASLSSLEVLSLAQNHLTGVIPPEIGNSLLALRELDLSGNELVGTIPSSFTNFTSLYSLNLGDNVFSGGFPEEVVGRMTSLHILIMSFNNLTGALPASLSNTSSLYLLDLSANAFTGVIPGTICGVSLRRLQLADNELTGAVPLGRCLSLAALDVSCNFISSTFPKPLPVLPNLQEFVMWGNLIAEEIPSDMCGAASQLKLLILNVNLIYGTIPPTMANCSSLEWFSLANNLLTGSIPPELGLMPRINYLHLNNNSLVGTIPPTLGDCKFLVWLDLSSNQLEGIIPPELAKQSGKVIKGTLDSIMHPSFFKYLQGDPCTQHGLGSVLMMGGIRPERLYKIPNFRTCKHTRLYLDITPYYFPGPPGSIQGGSLTYLDLAHNKLSGTIPEELGTMTSTTVLSLSDNNLTGNIPFSLANLIQCSILYLDNNNLQGPIPPGLSNLGVLNQFDVSSNNLSGSIPDTGKLPTFPASSFANNIYLCGPPLPSCYPQPTTSNNSPSQGDASTSSVSSGQWAGYSIAVAAVGTFIFLMICVCGLAHCMVSNHNRMKEHLMSSSYASSQPYSSSGSWLSSSGDQRLPLGINMTMFEKPLRKLNYQHLWEATKGFSTEAIIGRGGFGDVYKATLGDGTIVAVKKLAHTVGQGEREFIAEMETIGKIKHRNLVPLLGYCRIAEERLLVYEYMEGGSLDKWLHGNIQHYDVDGRPLEADVSEYEHMSKELSWESRKTVALGTARGLCFLHNSCIPHIIHRDLKSANVLLDDKLEARVSDFGMARLVSAAETHLSVSAVVGTPGYVPPEYGQSFRCTKQGDVYSFGVILLELITGRRPTWSTALSSDSGTTDREGNGNNNVAAQAITQLEESAIDLVGWVKRHVREGRAAEVLDEGALQGGNNAGIATVDIESREREMMAYLAIACQCVQERPFTRPTMANIMVGFRELHRGQEGDQ